MKYTKIFVVISILLFMLASCKVSDTSKKENEQVSYYIPIVEETTASFQMIGENEVQLSNVSFQIPEDFEVKSNDGELLLENEKRSLQITVEDKTEDITNWDNYIQETISSLELMGLSTDKVETTTLGSYSAKRFIVDTFDITSSSIRIFCYFVDMDDSKVVINVISRGDELKEVTEADNFISAIEFE